MQPKDKIKTPAPKPSVPKVVKPRNPAMNTKAALPKGYYQTGPNERKSIQLSNGNTLRMAPNTFVTPAAPKPNFLQTLLNAIRGRTDGGGGNFAGTIG